MSTYDKSGVSAAQADAARRALAALLKEEANRRCAECGARGPTWASVNLGVFVCLNCSGERWREGRGWLRMRRVAGEQLPWVAGGRGTKRKKTGGPRQVFLARCRPERSDSPTHRPRNTACALSTPPTTGIHRSLGTHISKVRSATLDTWLPAQVAWAGAMGNSRAAAFWEARLPPGFTRPAEGDMAALAKFIGAKYRCVV
jgi:hypothetical protein